MAVPAVTTYVYPVTGLAPPAAAVVKDLVVADVVFANVDDTVVPVTHNMGLGAGALALGAPIVEFCVTACGSAVPPPLPFVAFSDGNTIAVDKTATAANTTITVRVYIRRPHTIGM
jgi:hypothetical protein